MPPDQAMLLKVFVSLEGAFKKLDPGFDIMLAIQPLLHEAVIDRLSPQALGKRGLQLLTQYLELFADLPKEIRRGIYAAKTGQMKIRVELSHSHELQHLVTRAIVLLAVAGIASALLIAGSIAMFLTR
jgi:ubiquinone biosynthesis protein